MESALNEAVAQIERAKAAVSPVVHSFFDEPTNTATYVVWDPATRKAAIVDSVLDFDAAAGRTQTTHADMLIDEITRNGWQVAWILETHVHADHLSAAPYLAEKLGGKIVPFAGFLMPIQYEGINIEHLHVRNNVGLFDVSHMGEFILKGDQSLSLLQLICSNDVSSIGDGRAQYNCLINETGGIIDDLIIYKFNDNKLLNHQ